MPSPEVRAAEFFERGLGQQRLGQGEQACRSFEASIEQAPSPHALLQVGNCREPRDPLGALASFEAALGLAQAVENETHRQAYTDAAGQRIQTLLSRIPTLTLRGAQYPGTKLEIVSEDGVRVASAEFAERVGQPQRLNPGRYRLQVSAPNFQPQSSEFQLEPGQRLSLDVPALLPLAPPPVESGAPGRAEAPAQAVPSALASDRALSHPNDDPRARATASGPLRFRALPVAFAGSGLALLVTGLFTGQISSAAKAQLERECGERDAAGKRRCDPALANTKRRVDNYALATDVAWVSGVVLAGTGVALFLLDQNGPAPTRIQAGCFDAGCGLSAAGYF